MPQTHPLDAEIKAFDAMREELEEHHLGKFAVFHDGLLVGAFDTFENAARAAVSQFGRGPFLIREVGREPIMTLPASVAFRPQHAAS